jgi:hypothetical protein
MEQKGSVLRIETEKEVIDFLKNRQPSKPFRCPYLLVATDTIQQGTTVFEEGDLLCTCGFLDTCYLFGRAKADSEGRVVARCGRDHEGVEVVFSGAERT